MIRSMALMFHVRVKKGNIDNSANYFSLKYLNPLKLEPFTFAM